MKGKALCFNSVTDSNYINDSLLFYFFCCRKGVSNILSNHIKTDQMDTLVNYVFDFGILHILI